MLIYICDNCTSHVETRYHCTVCDNFDLCVNCKDKDGHPHPMEKLGFALDNGSLPTDKEQTTPLGNYERRTWIQRCSRSLTHACDCRDDKCHLPALDCQKMKRLMIHTQYCKRKSNGCPRCKQLITLCCYHAKRCQETKCLIPFCSIVKYKIKQQKLQQRLQKLQQQVRLLSL